MDLGKTVIGEYMGFHKKTLKIAPNTVTNSHNTNLFSVTARPPMYHDNLAVIGRLIFR